MVRNTYPLVLTWWRQHDITSIAKWLLAIWRSYVANNHWQFGVNYCKIDLTIWLHLIATCSLAILQQPTTKHTLAILATSYHVNRNNRVSSFYWTRESKLCFLTCFSYFIRYFHILVFLWNCYLLISLRLSWLHGNRISCPVSCTIGTPS